MLAVIRAASLCQVWDLTKRSRAAAHTLASPVPGRSQRFRAARLAFCRDNSDRTTRQAGAAHMAVYWAAEAPSDADDCYIALYQLSTEAAGAAQFDPALLAALPVCSTCPEWTSAVLPLL